MTLPRVFVVRPWYQTIDGNCSDAIRRVGPGEVFWTSEDCGDAFLARNFNACWVAMLNSRKRMGWTHFLMIHADVRPMIDDWGIPLLQEMDRTGADLLSVVLPIKTGHGQTSTAVEDPEGRIRMLTMREIDALPCVSFDAEKAGFPGCRILCSTGLWIAKIGDWATQADEQGRNQAWFEVRDRIVENPRYNPEWKTKEDPGEPEEWVRLTLPEDWHFSRRLHALGLKPMATRIVPCEHWGMAPFVNNRAWGTLGSAPWLGPFDCVTD